MNHSPEHPTHETSLSESALHDVLHAQVRKTDGDAYLGDLADGALRVARRRQRLTRAGLGIAAAVAVTAGAVTAGAVAAGNADQHISVAPPAAIGKPVPISILPVTSLAEGACARGDGGYTLSASHPAFCVHLDRARGMTGVHPTAAKADRSGVDGAWQVELTLTPADRAGFAALTGSVATAPPPGNELAIVIDGKVRSMPSVSTSITGGRLDITGAPGGELSSATAHSLALRLVPVR